MPYMDPMDSKPSLPCPDFSLQSLLKPFQGRQRNNHKYIRSSARDFFRMVSQLHNVYLYLFFFAAMLVTIYHLQPPSTTKICAEFWDWKTGGSTVDSTQWLRSCKLNNYNQLVPRKLHWDLPCPPKQIEMEWALSQLPCCQLALDDHIKESSPAHVRTLPSFWFSCFA